MPRADCQQICVCLYGTSACRPIANISSATDVTYLCAESFDDLLLMKVGGHIIYHGPLGPRSIKLVQYFEVS